MKKNYQKIILAMIFVLACAVRLYIHFSTDYIYWTNWAYYLVQVRSILENFSLWIPDMPLTFYIQAAVAKILEIFYSQSDAILYWVKIADSILPPLIIFPAFFLIKKSIYSWSNFDSTPYYFLFFYTLCINLELGGVRFLPPPTKK